MDGERGDAALWKRMRRRRYLGGLAAEWVAAGWLVLKGYRVIARRVRTAGGEIDLIAVRGRRIAFIEVKHRQDLAAAQASIASRQRQRVRKAAQMWLGKRPDFHEFEMGFDVVFLMPWRWPMHLENGLLEHRSL